jgi:hypothetical protein
MGVVPAGKPHPKAGHHHILVNQALPRDIAAKIPFSDNHRHFGKGQTSTVLSLPPGRHTLRLLFADHDHRPYFVYSPEVVVQVTGPRAGAPALRVDPTNFAATCRAWYQEELTRPRPEGKRVLVTNLRDEEPVVSPLNVRLAADGFGVAARGHGGEGLGHFQLEVRSTGAAERPPQVMDLSNGATQANLFLSPGRYRLRVRFFDDARRELVPPAEITLPVTAQDRIQ